MQARVGADVGGTFTDVILQRPDGTISLRKLLSTPPHYDRAVVAGIAELLPDPGGSISEVVHGTTVATNAVLAHTAQSGLIAVLAIIFAAAAALALVTTTATAAVVCSPIAGQIALASGLPAHQAFLAVAYGASCAFVLPNGHR